MPGEVHAVVGENGAGKSTLIKILGGVYQPDDGQLVVDGEARRFRSPREALSAGVVVIHQELSLAPSLSAEENIFLGRFPRNAFGVIDRGLIRARTRQVFEQLGITVAPQDTVATLSIAQQQMVEIAKAILADARILVLDEPTAVLDENRVDVLFATIERLRAKGLGIVFISHHLEEIFRIADRVTVLQRRPRDRVRKSCGSRSGLARCENDRAQFRGPRTAREESSAAGPFDQKPLGAGRGVRYYV